MTKTGHGRKIALLGILLLTLGLSFSLVVAAQNVRGDGIYTFEEFLEDLRAFFGGAATFGVSAVVGEDLIVGTSGSGVSFTVYRYDSSSGSQMWVNTNLVSATLDTGNLDSDSNTYEIASSDNFPPSGGVENTVHVLIGGTGTITSTLNSFTTNNLAVGNIVGDATEEIVLAGSPTQVIDRSGFLFETFSATSKVAAGNIIVSDASEEIAGINGDTLYVFDPGFSTSSRGFSGTLTAVDVGGWVVSPPSNGGGDTVFAAATGGAYIAVAYQQAQTATCGDGVVSGSEQCDPGPPQNLQGRTCQNFGFASGTLSCTSSCTFDTSQCVAAVCGNNVAEGFEECDGTDLRGRSCASFGFSGGTLQCNPPGASDTVAVSATGSPCTYDTSACTGGAVCGNNIIESGEVCDPPGSQTGACGVAQDTIVTAAGTCSLDCRTCCGDGFCAFGEDCPADCGFTDTFATAGITGAITASGAYIVEVLDSNLNTVNTFTVDSEVTSLSFGTGPNGPILYVGTALTTGGGGDASVYRLEPVAAGSESATTFLLRNDISAIAVQAIDEDGDGFDNVAVSSGNIVYLLNGQNGGIFWSVFTDATVSSLAAILPDVEVGAVCGNNIIESGEVCDPPGSQTGACGVAQDTLATASIQVCASDCRSCVEQAVCNDGVIDEGETCDDSNSIDGDGCSSTCQIEPGYTCTNPPGSPSICTLTCGNSIIDTGETCDDGNRISGDGCSSACQFENCIDADGDGFNITRAPGCGNGVLEVGEQCDDSNTNNNDACPNTCENAVCGDGFVHTGVEQCDDGNTNNNDACLNTCVSNVCGDGFVNAGVEQCDDANFDETDGCTSGCVNLCVEAPSGLVSWWPADGNTNDIQDGNPGTIIGESVSFTTGVVSQAFSFAGVAGERVNVANSANLNFGTGSFSMDAWFKQNVDGTFNIVTKGGSEPGYFMGILGAADNRVACSMRGFIVGDPSRQASDRATSSVPHSRGEWHHVACVFDRTANRITVYLDGNNVGTRTINTISPDNTADLLIGNSFNGAIDEVEIFNTALSSIDVFKLYNSGVAGKCRTGTSPPPNGGTTFGAAAAPGGGTTPFGSSCTSDAECETGFCDQSVGGICAFREVNDICGPIDCNDNNEGVFPGNAEICDGLDNNCNGLVDEGNVCVAVCRTNEDCSDGLACNGFETCSPGADLAGPDGCVAGTPVICGEEGTCFDPERNPGLVNTGVCQEPSGTCGTTDAPIEICDALDNDCDTQIDENDNEHPVTIATLTPFTPAPIN